MSSVSTVIPVFNGEKYLADAIESVLSQDHGSDVIVVDDGSTDRSGDVARSFGTSVGYYRVSRGGAAAARNAGAELAHGDLLAFLDADDLWVPGKLERQVRALNQDSMLEAVFGHVEQFVCPSLSEAQQRRLDCPPEQIPGYHPGTMLIRREAFFRVGPFGDHWEAGEFMDWYARAVDSGVRMQMLPEVVMRRRLHNTNQGVYRRESYARDYLRILREALVRRREKARNG